MGSHLPDSHSGEARRSDSLPMQARADALSSCQVLDQPVRQRHCARRVESISQNLLRFQTTAMRFEGDFRLRELILHTL